MKTQGKSQSGDDFPLLLQKVKTWIYYDMGGPRLLKIRHLANFFKGTTFLWVFMLMNYFESYIPAMFLYLLLHGSYGILWVIKDIWFPDELFNREASHVSLLAGTTLLASYWMIPVPLAAGYGVTYPSATRMISLMVMYLLGLILMLGSDYQKSVALSRRKGLISDGFLKYTRNPNYLGEILIYSSFVLCSGHYLGFIIFYGLGGLLFTTNIYLKEKLSYQKKEGWEEYRKRSYVLLPKIFATFTLNFVFYLGLFIGLVYFYGQETPSTSLYPSSQQ